MRQKVLAYILRQRDGQRQLLVFEHRDHPDAGVQVPAGTVEPGEAIEAALLREIEEESGLRAEQLGQARKLAAVYEAEWDQQRHVYAVTPHGSLPHRWSHTVRGGGEDQGMVFDYYWIDVTPGLKLAGGQEQFLSLAEESDRW